LALTISMLITDTLGRMNFGAMRAQAPSNEQAATANASARLAHRLCLNKVPGLVAT
jgi:hypothetical protein